MFNRLFVLPLIHQLLSEVEPKLRIVLLRLSDLRGHLFDLLRIAVSRVVLDQRFGQSL